MNLFKAVILTSLPLMVMGCFETRKNTDQLCQQNPHLRCEELNTNDGQCRVPRTDLIWHRFDVFKDPSDSNRVKEYHLIASYKKCLELAAQIQPIDQTDLKQKRFEALMHAGAEEERVVNELQKIRTPEVLYFLWSQIGDENAKREFLRLEGTPQLETAEMQYALATFYTSRDQEKTVRLLLHSLELSQPKSVNVDIFKSLASTYFRLNQKELAYIWAMVAKENGSKIANERELQLLYGFDEDKYSKLDDIADDIASSIKSGKYSNSLIPNDVTTN